MKARKIRKTNVVIFRVTDSLKSAIQLVVSRGNYKSMSDLISALLHKQFRKHLSSEERRVLLRNKKRVNPG